MECAGDDDHDDDIKNDPFLPKHFKLLQLMSGHIIRLTQINGQLMLELDRRSTREATDVTKLNDFKLVIFYLQ